MRKASATSLTQSLKSRICVTVDEHPSLKCIVCTVMYVLHCLKLSLIMADLKEFDTTVHWSATGAQLCKVLSVSQI